MTLFAICAALLLSTASIVFFVSSTCYEGLDYSVKSETQPTPVADSIPETEIQSIPTNTSTQEDQSITSQTNSTQETEPAPDAIAETAFYVIPQGTIVNVNNTFSVLIFAANVTDLYGWQIRLSFDPKVVECVNVSLPEQNVFSFGYPVSQALVDYNSTEFTKRPLQYIDNKQGYVLAGDCLIGSNQTTFYGSGFLCKITFKAISSGYSKLTLIISDTNGLQTFCIHPGCKFTTHSVFSGEVTVYPE